MVTSKFHPPSKPQPYNRVSSTRVTMPCTRSSDLIHPIADRLYPFTNIPPLLPSYSPWQPLSSCFCESDFFFDATDKWLPSTFCSWLVNTLRIWASVSLWIICQRQFKKKNKKSLFFPDSNLLPISDQFPVMLCLFKKIIFQILSFLFISTAAFTSLRHTEPLTAIHPVDENLSKVQL